MGPDLNPPTTEIGRENSGIPPTGVGGWFRSNLHARTNRVLESHQRKLVDDSDPASETKRPSVFKCEFSFMPFNVDEQVGSEPSTHSRSCEKLESDQDSNQHTEIRR